MATRENRQPGPSGVRVVPFVPVQTSGPMVMVWDMFTSQVLIVEARLDAARERLARMVADGGLTRVSRGAYHGALTRLIRVGPFGETPGVSKQVQVRLIGPVWRDGTTTVWLRWEATGRAGGLFPVLDADLLLKSEGLDKTRVKLNGCYRPPLGRLGAGLDRAVLHRVAAATIRALLRGIADTLAEPKHAPGPLPGMERQHSSSAVAVPSPDTLTHAAPGQRSAA
jgi:hypothetical protein